MAEITPGVFVRKHRKLLGFSQEELGKAVGVSRGYINLIENASYHDGDPPNLSNDLLERLADRLGVSHTEVLEVFDRPMIVTDRDIR